MLEQPPRNWILMFLFQKEKVEYRGGYKFYPTDYSKQSFVSLIENVRRKNPLFILGKGGAENRDSIRCCRTGSWSPLLQICCIDK